MVDENALQMIAIGSVKIDFNNLDKWFRIAAEYLIEIVSKPNKNERTNEKKPTKNQRQNCELWIEIQKPFNR